MTGTTPHGVESLQNKCVIQLNELARSVTPLNTGLSDAENLSKSFRHGQF